MLWPRLERRAARIPCELNVRYALTVMYERGD
jgi:hypothetical protein